MNLLIELRGFVALFLFASFFNDELSTIGLLILSVSLVFIEMCVDSYKESV